MDLSLTIELKILGRRSIGNYQLIIDTGRVNTIDNVRVNTMVQISCKGSMFTVEGCWYKNRGQIKKVSLTILAVLCNKR